MTALSDWLHKLPGPHVQALRDFRKCARAAYPNDPDYIATALAGDLVQLLMPATSPRKMLSPAEAAAVIAAMPREFVLAVDH